MKTVLVTLAKANNEIWAQANAPGFLRTTVGRTIEEIEANLKALVADYIEHEDKTDPEWVGVGIDDIRFEYVDRAVPRG